MGRTATAEPNSVDNVLDNMFISPKVQWGLVIGHLTVAQKDHFIALIPTPEDTDESENTKKAESTSSGKSSKKPSSDKQQISVQAQIETIDQNWFIGHATQVRQSLQGGLDVVGLYIYAPTELTIKTTSTAAKLRQLVFALGALAGSEPTVTADRYLVHVCSSTKKKILRTYNTADYRSTIATAEYKPQALVQKFQTFQSSYSFKIQSYMTPGSLESTGQRLKKLLTTELSSLSKLVILQGDSIINNSSSNSLLVDPTAKQLELLAPISSPAHFDNTNGPSIVETPTLIELSGSVKVLGCVHPKSTESDLYHSIVSDLYRTLSARIEFLSSDLTESLKDLNSDQTPGTLVQVSPTRVLYPLLQASDILLSDYLYSDTESLEVSRNRVSTLFGDNLVDLSKGQECEVAGEFKATTNLVPSSNKGNDDTTLSSVSSSSSSASNKTVTTPQLPVGGSLQSSLPIIIAAILVAIIGIIIAQVIVLN